MGKQKIVEVLISDEFCGGNINLEGLVSLYNESVGERQDLSDKVESLERDLRKVENIEPYLEQMITERNALERDYNESIRRAEQLSAFAVSLETELIERTNEVSHLKKSKDDMICSWKLIVKQQNTRLEKMAKEEEGLEAKSLSDERTILCQKKEMGEVATMIKGLTTTVKKMIVDQRKRNAEALCPGPLEGFTDSTYPIEDADITFSTTLPEEKE